MNRQLRRKLQKTTRTTNLPEVNAHIKRLEGLVQTQRLLIERYEQELKQQRSEDHVSAPDA